jgi:flagellar motor switch protein FliM
VAPEDLDIKGDSLEPDLAAAVDTAEALAGSVAPEEVDLDDVLGADSTADVVGEDGPRRYDFNRPHSISRIFEKNLQAVGESFAKTATIEFTSLLRTTVQVEYRGLRQTSFGDYQAEMPNPTSAALIGLEPLKGLTLLHLDLNLCYVFMQKLMGGPLDADGPVREFTEIERGINANLVDRFTEIVRKSLGNWTEVTPRFIKLENNPAYLSGIAEGESLIIVRCHMVASPAEGPVELAFPLAAFGPVREVFDPHQNIELRDDHELRDDRRRILNMVQGTESRVVAELGEIPTNLEEILNLAEGDVIRLPQSVQAPLKVKIEGQDVWLGEAGRLGQKRAVKLIRQLNKE